MLITNSKIKITVIGVGYVGLVTAICFAHFGYEVTCLDVDKSKIDRLNHGECVIYEPGLQKMLTKHRDNLIFTSDDFKAFDNCDAIFICVGTPEKEDGTCDLSYVYKVADSIAKYVSNNCLVVIKSTVPVGTNELVKEYIESSLAYNVKLLFASNPEFLAQGSAVKDTLEATRIVIGAESENAIEALKIIYRPFNLPYVVTNIRSAELMKYACNAFLATKISFINEMANLCELLGADINDIRKGMGLDPRIGNKFINPGIGYGGSCFSKDTKALLSFAKEAGYDLRIVESTIEVNEEQRLILVKKLKKDYPSLKGLRVAILGVTYKPNTNDLRDAPSLDIIKELLSEGVEIYAYDPVAITELKEVFEDKIHYCHRIKKALEHCEIVMILTEWKQIVDVDRSLLKDKVIYDGRNCMR